MVATTEKDPGTQTGDEKPEAASQTGAAEEASREPEDTDATAVDEAGPDNTDDADDPDDAADEGGTPLKCNRGNAERRKRPWGHYLRRGTMPLLLAASLAVSGFLGWKQWQEHQLHQAGEQARQAAIAYAGVLTSIDSNNVDQNFKQVLDGATGEFKDMYTQSSVQLRQLLIDNKATAHGVVVDSAIASESKNKVVVLLFIDQTVTNVQVPDPRIDRSRIKMTMEKVDGHWRAGKVQLL